MRLGKRASVILTPTSPFHFDGTMFNPSYFPGPGSHWEPGSFWMGLRWRGRPYGVRLRSPGAGSRTRVTLTVYAQRRPSRATLASIAEEISWRFDLNSMGVPEFVRRFRRDPYVGPLIRRRPGMRPHADILSLYEYLVITVLLQNTVVRRSVSMLRALYERFGQRVEFDGKTLWTFWEPGQVHEAPEEELRALKVGYRARILKRQAAQFVSGEVDEAALRRVRDQDAVAEALDGIYGVGPQSAGYMLMGFFHFYRGTEHLSPWEAKIMGRLLFGRATAPDRIVRFLARRYGEFSGLAGSYIFVDAFWRHRAKPIPWLAREIRL